MASDFRARVLAVVRHVPKGRVVTYGDVARLAGRPRAWRAVGTHLRHCQDPGVPCHRVVGAGGSLGGYAGNPEAKRQRLRAEGLSVGLSSVRGFHAVRWRPPSAIAAPKSDPTARL